MKKSISWKCGKRVAFWTSVTLVFFCANELFLRIKANEFSGKRFNEVVGASAPSLDKSAHLVAFDHKLGWIPAAGMSAQKKGKNFTILPSGLRSNGSKGKLITKYTILATGDSFTYCDAVDDKETWPAYLEYKLGVRVLNGGVSGYGLDQIYLRTVEYIEKMSPDLVLVSFIEDDIQRTEMSFRFAPKPFYWYKENKLFLDQRPFKNWLAADYQSRFL